MIPLDGDDICAIHALWTTAVDDAGKDLVPCRIDAQICQEQPKLRRPGYARVMSAASREGADQQARARAVAVSPQSRPARASPSPMGSGTAAARWVGSGTSERVT